MATTPPPTRPPDRITEDRYKVARYMTQYRKKNPRRYNTTLRPLLMEFEFGPMLRNHAILRRTDADIKPAVNLWCSNRVEAEERYGHIGYWDVSSVTNMRHLFINQTEFNDDITQWDVSNVTNMAYMFSGAFSFNQAIGDWDVSNVTNMQGMFSRAFSFNQAIGDWVVSNVTDMSYMFNAAQSFNQPIGTWDVSNVLENRNIFYRCPISNTNKPPGLLGGGSAKKTLRIRRANRKRSRKGRRTLKRGTRRRTRRR